MYGYGLVGMVETMIWWPKFAVCLYFGKVSILFHRLSQVGLTFPMWQIPNSDWIMAMRPARGATLQKQYLIFCRLTFVFSCLFNIQKVVCPLMFLFVYMYVCMLLKDVWDGWYSLWLDLKVADNTFIIMYILLFVVVVLLLLPMKSSGQYFIMMVAHHYLFRHRNF